MSDYKLSAVLYDWIGGGWNQKYGRPENRPVRFENRLLWSIEKMNSSGKRSECSNHAV